MKKELKQKIANKVNQKFIQKFGWSKDAIEYIASDETYGWGEYHLINVLDVLNHNNITNDGFYQYVCIDDEEILIKNGIEVMSVNCRDEDINLYRRIFSFLNRKTIKNNGRELTAQLPPISIKEFSKLAEQHTGAPEEYESYKNRGLCTWTGMYTIKKSEWKKYSDKLKKYRGYFNSAYIETMDGCFRIADHYLFNNASCDWGIILNNSRQEIISDEFMVVAYCDYKSMATLPR